MTLLSTLRNLQNDAIGGGGLDSAEVQDVGLKRFLTIDSLPSANLVSGQTAWVESSGRLYVSNGSGWYNIALLNASPTLSLDQSGTIQLNADTLSVTVTASATDTDDPSSIITFSVESDGNMLGTGTTVSQDSSVFTVTADSQGGNGVAGDFTLTFKATDQIAVDNEALSFSLTFSNVIDSSSGTIFLMKARGNSATNSTINYIDAAGNDAGFTEAGLVQATSFSPYRSGGYSTHFDGGDRLLVSDDAALDVGTGDFTVEAWMYLDDDDGTYNILSHAATGGMWLGKYASGFVWRRYGVTNVVTATTDPTENEWHHIAVARSGSSTKMFIDGVQTGSTASDTANYSVSSTLYIGDDGGANSQYMKGYIRDLRITKGVARYTANFDVPTEALTSDDDTSLLACSLPYVADASSNQQTITFSGDPGTRAFGPYNYEAYDSADVCGSVHFDGDNTELSDTSFGYGFGTGDMTIEGWIYPTEGSNWQHIVGLDGYPSSGWVVWLSNSNKIHFYYNGSSGAITPSKVVPIGAWTHFSVNRSGTGSNETKIYVNGVQDAQGTVSTSYAVDGIEIGNNQTYDFHGYIADLRVTKGQAIRTAAFTPPTSPLSGIPIAPASHVLHLKTNSDFNVYDNAGSNAMTLIANTVSSTTQRKFSTSSAVYFDGAGDAIEVTPGYDDPRYKFGTEDFTIEMWLYATNLTSARTIGGLIKYNSSGGRNVPYFYTSGTTLYYWTDGTNRITGTSALTLNTWHHVAVTRSGNDHKMFVDGTQVGSTWNNAADYVQGRPSWGNYYNTEDNLYTGASNQFSGYIQDLRITKGYARYTANFTAPTAEFDL